MYSGLEFGAGWSGAQAVDYSPNDFLSTLLLNGSLFGSTSQPVPNGFRISRTGPVGGFEAGYNWQAGSNWVLGLETDFSLSDSGQASGSSIFSPGSTQSTTANQRTDWYGTIRARAGWLATPNLLLFGTGGFAYGRVDNSASFLINAPPGVVSVGAVGGGIPRDTSFLCPNGVTCIAGSSSAVRTGWAAGGGAEWRLDQHWSAKVEYQFVDLGSETVRITALTAIPPSAPSSFNAIFRDQFHVVRVGLNYWF
jgi:outer membrane immunogenic protein